MKRCLLLAMLMIAAASAAAGFPIRSYDSTMDIQRDSTVLVSERIVADFTGEPHHGIYRDIPLGLRDSWGNETPVRISDINVTDEHGASLQTQVTYPNGTLHIRIGSPDVYVSDARTYVVRYRLERAIGYFKDHDELYWNVVGDRWEVPIERATATVTLPTDLPDGQSLRTAVYTGSYGSTGSDAYAEATSPNAARFVMKRALAPGEGMTIVVGWPKGIVAPPSARQKTEWFLRESGFFLLPPVFLIGLIWHWFRAGRDPDAGRSEVVRYDPPDGMSPAEIGTLIDEKVDSRDIAASVVDLAVRGYLKIEVISDKVLLWRSTDYWLELTKPYDEVKSDPDLSEFERLLVTAIFGGSQGKMMSALKNHFYTHIPTLRNKLYDAMVKRHYFGRRPDSVRSGYTGGGVVLVILGIACGVVLVAETAQVGTALGWGAAIAACGLMLIASARTMPRKTFKGKEALTGVRGFEEYLSRAEGVEVRYQEEHNLFEKFLPYAIALGIADRWANAFETLNIQPPQWYSGGEGMVFSTSSFVSDMNHATSSWSGTMSSQPRSSGGYGGGGGFSGGSSGGGGGGGGGGGW